VDELVKTLIGIVVIFFLVVAPPLKKVLERGKAPAPKPRGPAGGGEGAPIRNLRDFLKQLEDLAQERRPAPPEPSPQQRAPAPIPVPPRRPPQAAQKAARRAQIAARARAEAEARAREAAVKARLFAAAAPAVEAPRGAAVGGSAGAATAAKAAAGARLRRSGPGRLPLVPVGRKEDLRALIVWSEILGRPRAARPWRAPIAAGR